MSIDNVDINKLIDHRDSLIVEISFFVAAREKIRSEIMKNKDVTDKDELEHVSR